MECSKSGVLKEWNSKVSGKIVEGKIVDTKIEELISQFWIDIQERNHDSEIITLSHAQDGVEALMDRSLKLVTTLAAYQTINFQDEELTITIERKRGNSAPTYHVSSSAAELTPSSIRAAPSVEHAPTGAMTESQDEGPLDMPLSFAHSVSKLLSEFRSSSN